MTSAAGRGRAQVIAPYAACALVIATGMVFSGWKAVAIDEAYTMETVSGGMGRAFHQALTFELQPPLYFVMVRAWMALHHSVAFARLFSALCAGLTVLVLYRTAIRGRQGSSAWRVLAMAVVCAPLIWAGTEARTYALAMLLSAASIYCFMRLWVFEEPPPRWCMAAWIAVSCAALLTHYYTGFQLLGQGLAVLLMGRRRPSLFVAAGILALLMLPWLGTILGQVATHPSTPPTGQAALGLTAALAVTYPLFQSHLLLLRPLFLASTVVVMVVLAGSFGFTRRHDPDREWAAVWIVLGTSVLVFFLLKVTGTTAVEDHHWVIMTPAALLAVAGAPVSVMGVRAARILLAVTWLLSAAATGNLARNLSPTDYRGAGQLLARSVGSDEAVFVFPPEQVLPMKYVYPRPASLRGLPFDAPDDVYPYPDSIRVIQDPCAVVRRLAAFPLRDRAWLVVRPFESRGARKLNEALEGVPRNTAEFSGIAVWEVALTPPVQDSLVGRFCTR